MRKLENWIDSFVDYTAHRPSPTLFRRWAGIFTVAAALERRVFTDVGRGGSIYPHQYIALVGPPGVGKSTITSLARELLGTLNPDLDKNGFHIGSSSLTSASLLDELADSTRNIVYDDATSDSFNSLTLVSDELGSLLTEYDNAMINRFTDLYDGRPFGEKRRTHDRNIVVQRPQISLLAGTTPSYLNTLLPPGAWEQGFMARVLPVFSSEVVRVPMFALPKSMLDLEAKLIADLKQIFSLHGPMVWSPEAAQAIINWDASGGLPAPEHPKLVNYQTRRTFHFAKLCMIAAVSAHDKLQIELEDFRTALDWFIEMEVYLPDIFKAMVVGGDKMAMDECWLHFHIIYVKEKRPVAEHRIYEFLAARVPAYSVPAVMKVMIAAGIFEQVIEKYGAALVPKPRQPRDTG